jgi:replication factor C subunit 1
LGFNTIEQNASDLRNSSSIKEKLTSLLNNTVFTNNWEAITKIKGSSRPETNTSIPKIQMKANKCAIVMDEVDGMASDRGGLNALTEFIKKARQPIICICNDRNHPKIRTLATHCLDLQFKPPSLYDIKKLLKRVQAFVNVYRADDLPEFQLPNDHELQVITDTCKGDIRQILNHIQLWYQKLSSNIVKGITQKDLDNSMNINDAVKVLLNSNKYVKPISKQKAHKENSILLNKLKRLTFVDYELLPFFFLENHTQFAGKGKSSFNKQSFLLKKFGGNTDLTSCGFKEKK